MVRSEDFAHPRAYGLRQLDKHISSGDGDRKGGMAELGVQTMPAGRDIELPPMPWTGDHVATNDPCRERPTRMRTDSIKCVKAGFQMEQGNNSSAGNKLTPRTNGDIRDRSDSMKLGHQCFRSAQTRPPQPGWFIPPDAAVQIFCGFSVHSSSVDGPRSTARAPAESLAPELRYTVA